MEQKRSLYPLEWDCHSMRTGVFCRSVGHPCGMLFLLVLAAHGGILYDR